MFKTFFDMIAKKLLIHSLPWSWLHYICKAVESKQMLDKQAYKILIEISSLLGIKSNFTLLPSSGLNIYFEVICPLDGSSMAMHLI